MNATTVRLPRVYAQDWMNRCGDDHDHAEVVKGTYRSREWTLELDADALADLISDVEHYTSPVMQSEFWESCRGIVLSARTARERLAAAGLMS